MAAMQHQHKSHILLLPVSLLLVAAEVVAGGGRTSSLIRSTCAAMDKFEQSTPYHYCVRMLSTHPTTAFARDARGLATATAELTVANMTKTIHFLKDLISGLQGCVLAYQEMQGSVTAALDDLSAGRLHQASLELRVASWQPDYCDLDLLQIFDKDPIDDENQANHLLSGLATNIVSLIPVAAPAPSPRAS